MVVCCAGRVVMPYGVTYRDEVRPADRSLASIRPTLSVGHSAGGCLLPHRELTTSGLQSLRVRL